MFYILIVDDEASMRDSIRKRYTAQGHQVLEAADGEEGLALFRRHRKAINLVITDILMPKMNGSELIAAIRALDPIVPIVGITAHDKDQLSILGSGAYYYLAKPLPPWGVVDRLFDNAVRQYRSERSERESSSLVRGYVGSHSARSLEGSRVELVIEQIDTPGPSGDFAEAMALPNGQVLFYVADVSGHGELTPCLMACLSSILLHRTQYERGDLDLARLAKQVDQGLRHLLSKVDLAKPLYLTLFLGCLDVEDQKLHYVNAAHPDAIICRAQAGRAAELLESTGLPVAMQYREIEKPGVELRQSVDFRPGDVVFLYSDGAAELLGGEGNIKGGIRLLQGLAESASPCSPRVLVDGIRDHLLEVAGGLDNFPDDTTLMAIRLAEPPADPPAAG